MIYADTSAIVKLYADEAHCEWVRAQIRPFAASALIQVEVAAALWRKYRIGDLDVGQVSDLVADFRADLLGIGLDAPRFMVTETSPVVLAEAFHAVARHQLRSYDAVHLATAIIVADLVEHNVEFAAFDHDLRRAAAVEGFTVVPKLTDEE